MNSKKNILFTWVGMVDIKAATGKISNSGPVLQAIQKGKYDEIHLFFYINSEENTKSALIKKEFEWLNSDGKYISLSKKYGQLIKSSPPSESGTYKSFFEDWCKNNKRNPKFENFLDITSNTTQMADRYIKWINDKYTAHSEIQSHKFELDNENDSNSMYKKTLKVVETTFKQSPRRDREITFFLSPGTPSMAFVWTMIAFSNPIQNIKLIASSDHSQGIRDLDIPFKIYVEKVHKRSRQESQKLIKIFEDLEEPASFLEMIAIGPAIKSCKDEAKSWAYGNEAVLILGETGTGKEAFAKAIHEASARKEAYIKCINCGAIPENLIESELFGTTKGAYSGAIEKKGLFEEAKNGTVFLDEIGDLRLQHQVAILRALQENKIRRVGGNKDIDIDVRILTATNKNLHEEISKNNFRADLFYRIAVGIIKLPPLRERKEDIPELINYYLDKVNHNCKDIPTWKSKSISAEALKYAVEQYEWPGNIRELINVLTRASRIPLNIGSRLIDLETFKKSIACITVGRTSQNDYSLESMINTELGTFKLEEVIKFCANKAMKETGNRKNLAAKLLGITRPTLDKYLKMS